MSKRRELIIHRAAVVGERMANVARQRKKRAPLSRRGIRRRLRKWLFGLSHRDRGEALRRLRNAKDQLTVEVAVTRAAFD